VAELTLDLVGAVAVSDALAVELDTFEPRPEDTAAVSDSVEAATDYHRELDADAVEVLDELDAELSQTPGEIVRELADAAAVADVVEALLTDGNIHTVTSVTPQRSRPGDTVTIRGTGFAASNNSIRLDGTACSIVTQSTTEIVITAPTTFNVTEGFAVLQVNNFDNNRVTEVPHWITDAVADLEAASLSDQTPGPFEDAGAATAAASTGSTSSTGGVVEDPTKAEARMWERMATMVDFLLRDNTPAVGDILVRDAAGIVGLDGDAASEDAGQRLVADSAAAEGVRWGHAADIDFPFGGRLAQPTTGAQNLQANGLNSSTTTGQADEWVAPLPGTIDACYVYQQSDLFGDDNLSLVRILVNGSEEYTRGAISVSHRNRHFAGNLSIAVVAGDRIQLEVTKNGSLDTMDLLGAVRMMTT